MSIREVYLDPITRIEGHLSIHVKMDVNAKKIIDAHSIATMFRGWEIILKRRDPPDAIFITQRICGVCPVPHGYASAIALDMALQVSPPPLAIVLRNLCYAAEILYDHPIQLFQLAGPDFSALEVEKFNPTFWNAAQTYSCEYRDVHGYATIADLIKAMNPLSGELYLFALKMERLGRKMASLIGAKHPHVNTFVPGGIARTWGIKEAEQLASMVITLTGFMKMVYAVWEDIIQFFYDMGYENVGVRPANLIAFGSIEDPDKYNAKYEDITEWGRARLITPGVVLNGELITTDLKDIHLRVREFVEHSFYEEWEGEFSEDPEGNPLDPNHPWNKETRPKPVSTSFTGKYTWATTPRWAYNGAYHVLGAGPIARMWTTAAAGLVNITDPFVEIRTGNGQITLELPETRSEDLPQSLWDATEIVWSVPDISVNGTKVINTLERYRARAFCVAYYAATALHDLYLMIDLVNKGKVEVWHQFTRPALSFGVGLNEAARGALGHWVVVKNGRIHRYQVITPTNWNVSPRDPNGNPGPIEEALIDTPITEESDASNWVGIDAVRTVRSFDPCLACTVHMYMGRRLVKKVLSVHGL